MAKNRDDLNDREEEEDDDDFDRNPKSKSKRRAEDSDSTDTSSESDDDRNHNRKRKRRSSSHRRNGDVSESSGSDSTSDSEYSGSEESEDERRRRKRKERRKREERERKREKEKKRKRREKEDEKRRKKKKDEKKKKKKEKGKIGAVTNSWGKFGVIRETDMWNKRPEFTAWLLEVKKVNLESLSNWEEKKMFKEYMEDFNTGTFSSKKYYDLDAYHRQKIEKAMKKGFKKVVETERTVFNDEEQRRLELMQAREKQKEQEVETLKNSMPSGMAQAMIEQTRLREEMAYLFKIGNSEAAAIIQRKLDPDVAM